LKGICRSVRCGARALTLRDGAPLIGARSTGRRTRVGMVARWNRPDRKTRRRRGTRDPVTGQTR